MKRILSIILFMFYCFVSNSSYLAAQGEPLIGHWQAEANLDSSIVEIFVRNGKVEGQIQNSIFHNYAGYVIIKSISTENNNNWDCTFFDPKVRKEYRASIKMNSPDLLTIKVKWGLLNFPLTWKRIN
ncbi:DUF2147 domain-containing protein [Bacteroidales bacterium]|nr:DUF2147 domain-containing protein [Bacteroidales bacterium]